MVSGGCTGNRISSENGSGSGSIAESGRKALYRTTGGSTLVPVQVPAAVPIVSYESSVFGSGLSGEWLPFPRFKSSVFGSGRVEGATEGRWIGEIRRRLFPREPVSSSLMTGNMTFLGRARTPSIMTHGNLGGVRAVMDVYRKTEWVHWGDVGWLQS